MKIKRILSATLAAAMLLCCCILTAFAESETYMGSLNGYSYVCSASCRSDEAKANMSSQSSETLIISGPLKYVTTDGTIKTHIISVNSTKSVQSTIPKSVKYFVSLTARFKIGSVTVQSISVDA
jgi:hypothetical protein